MKDNLLDLIYIALIFLVFAAIVYGCQSPGNKPVQPTPVVIIATKTPLPTVTPTATAPPTITPRPTPTPLPEKRATVTPTPSPTPTATADLCRYVLTHEIQPGDWLSTIAAHYYNGAWDRWPDIWQCTNNRAPLFPNGCIKPIDNPDLIYPGNCVLVPVIK